MTRLRAEPATSAGTDVGLSQRMATSSKQLFIRRAFVQLLSAASTAVLARKLGVADFGAYSAGLAGYYFAMSVCDFGFSYVLARTLGAGRADDGAAVRAMLRAQTLWSCVVGLIAASTAMAVGLGAVRMKVLLVLVPALACFGLTGFRQVFYAAYATARLGKIDVLISLVQSLLLVTVALGGGGPVALAVTLSATIVVNTAVVAIVGRRLIDDGRPAPGRARRMLLDALPLGVSSLLATAYFTLDLSIVGFLVSARQLGYYAAATKALSLLVTVPGMVMTAALPGISSKSATPEDLGWLLARVWSWLCAIALPLCLGVILFAPLFVRVFFGGDFGPAVLLTRVLAASGIVALLTNVLGTAMVAIRRSQWLIVEAGLALVGNVAGNLLLVPHYGVMASAWLTVGTEVFIVAGSTLGLRGKTTFAPLLRSSRPVIAATAAMVLSALLLGAWPIPGMVASGAAYLTVLSLLGGWPPELVNLRRPFRKTEVT